MIIVGLIGGAVWLLSGDKAKELKVTNEPTKKAAVNFRGSVQRQHTINWVLGGVPLH